MSETGYPIERWLPDGRLVALTPLTFGRWRLIIGGAVFVDDAW